MMGTLTATVVVERRSLLGRIRRLPHVYREHYRTLRQSNGRLVSLYAAWLMAGLLIRVK